MLMPRMLMQRWSVSDYQTMPWKNGGGSTTELAIFPAGANLDNFIWRLSTAQVATDGPFSHFHGIDRTLAVLSDAGLILHTKAEPGTTPPGVVHLTQDSPPYRFPGELALDAELSDGCVLDLNIMTRRDVCTHTMRKLLSGHHHIDALGARQILLYCVAGNARMTSGETFSSGELMLLSEARPASGIALELIADQGAILYLIALQFFDKGAD
ncbi:HutD family protein [Undibacterium sp. FT147W]|uniref:HutD family protein n=1 Tax=Undibacterium rivi TaxID=2828729 RepID=A0ABS5H206_9BURK|nr:HutD family protein [Undibacterium rivi]MBR7792736.1 HutD family protein [Undibacterium rivi]